MTWGALLKALLTDPLAWGFALIVGTFAALGGYFYGRHSEHVSNEAVKKAAIVEAYKEVRPKEKEVAESTNKASKDHEQTKQSNKAVADVVVSDYRGLRVESTCSNQPTIAASSGEPVTSAGSERPRTGEADFEGIARKVVELGNDYDDAVSQIKGLNATLEAYRKACNAE